MHNKPGRPINNKEADSQENKMQVIHAPAFRKYDAAVRKEKVIFLTS